MIGPWRAAPHGQKEGLAVRAKEQESSTRQLCDRQSPPAASKAGMRTLA